MDGPLKELTKLEKLTSNASAKGKTPSVNDSLDSLLQSLREVQDRLKAGTVTGETLTILAKTVETKKREVDERIKEVYNSLREVGKALDKVRSIISCASVYLNRPSLEILHSTAVVSSYVRFTRS